jgi:hypothetical protein
MITEAKFGHSEGLDWRKATQADQEEPDDDEELLETPEDVVDMLGFDPLEEDA